MTSPILNQYLPQIEAQLKELLTAPSGEFGPFYGMMHYHLGWVDANLRPSREHAGKRLRPTLCLLACQAAGGDLDRALPAAAALELLHNFSQIHDDIEDGDEERRHRPTLWRLWGVPQALNAGDGMMSLVYPALLSLREKGVKPETVHRVLDVFSRMYRELCEGQYMDIAFEERASVSLEEYLSMIQRKTASLIAASTQVGAMLATENQHTIQALRRFGENLGLAFQVVDDILGIWGSTAVTGKPVANDIRRRKKTLPVIYALGKDTKSGQELAELYGKDELGAQEVRRVLELLELCGARRYCQERAAAFHCAALEALDLANLPDARAAAELKALANFLLEREY